jgi:transcriptional regulator with XRE-family HTH domain
MPPSSIKVNGPRIRELREKKGWERPEFAALIGVSSNRVYKIERLEQVTRLITLRRIAAVLGVSPEELTAVEAEPLVESW